MPSSKFFGRTFVKVIIAGCTCENPALSVDTLCSIIVFSSALVPMGALNTNILGFQFANADIVLSLTLSSQQW